MRDVGLLKRYTQRLSQHIALLRRHGGRNAKNRSSLGIVILELPPRPVQPPPG
jgi:hypothetical protein